MVYQKLFLFLLFSLSVASLSSANDKKQERVLKDKEISFNSKSFSFRFLATPEVVSWKDQGSFVQVEVNECSKAKLERVRFDLLKVVRQWPKHNKAGDIKSVLSVYGRPYEVYVERDLLENFYTIIDKTQNVMATLRDRCR